jgi:hypothetical protein
MTSSPCPNCQGVVPAGSLKCPSCGEALSPTGSRPVKFNTAAVTQVERTIGIATFVLLVSLFLPWYSASGVSEDALSAHGYLYITLFAALAMIALIGGQALGMVKLPDESPVDRNQLLLAGTGLNVILIVIAFIFKPSGLGIVNVGWSFGAIVGIVSAVVAAVPLGLPYIRTRRGK